MDNRDLFAAVLQGIVESELSDASAVFPGQDSGCLGDSMWVVADGNEVLDSNVEAPCIFSDQNEIDIGEFPLGEKRAPRSQICVQPESLSQADID